MLFGGLALGGAFFDRIRKLDESAGMDADRGRIDVRRLAPLGVVHQLIRAVDQFRGELARHAAASATGPRWRQTTPTSTRTGRRGQPAIVPAPVVAFHRLLEAIGDFDGFGAARQIGNQEAEFVAAEPRVQIARIAAALERQKIFRTGSGRTGCARRAR